MESKVVAFVAVVGAAAGGAGPLEAQIADAVRTGRASGELYAPGRYERDCRDGAWHRWDEGWRSDDCWGDRDRRRDRDGRDARRNERWDARHDDRFEARFRGDRSHRLLLERLDRLHADWHRHHGWLRHDRRYWREHRELHRRLERIHDDWHRHDRRDRIRGW